MKEYVCKSFHAVRLLTAGDLDIRKVAAEQPRLKADDYFSKLERFVEKVPQYAENLGHVADPKELWELQNGLTEIGYGALVPDIEGIRDAIEAGKQALATKWAAELADKLNAFCGTLKEAQIKKRGSSNRTTDDIESTSDSVLLSEALEYFDYAEANRKLRILAVDDVAVVLSAITSILSKDYEVFALTNASQVEKFLAHTTPELFLLDIEMPEMNGYDIVRVIRQFEAHKDTPIIFLTGNASMENLKTAISLGACDFITKPINPGVLLEKIADKIAWKKAF